MLNLEEVFKNYYKSYESDGWKVTKDTIAPNHIDLLLLRDYDKGRISVMIKAYVFSLDTDEEEDIRYTVNVRQIYTEREGKDSMYRINELEHIISNNETKFIEILKEELTL